MYVSVIKVKTNIYIFTGIVERAAINRDLPNETLHILKNTKIFQEISTSHFLDFISMEARLKTFESNTSLTINQSFKSLADAGFFYTGKLLIYLLEFNFTIYYINQC